MPPKNTTSSKSHSEEDSSPEPSATNSNPQHINYFIKGQGSKLVKAKASVEDAREEMIAGLKKRPKKRAVDESDDQDGGSSFVSKGGQRIILKVCLALVMYSP
jgi:hypothetical protein